MTKRLLLILAILSVFLCACNRGKTVVTNNTDTPYCEDSAMAHFMSDPERAMVLLDSAMILNNLEKSWGTYFKAIVAYNGLRRSDSCLVICKGLLEDEVWKELDSEGELYFRVRLYNLMAAAASSLGDSEAVVQYATEGINLTHDNEDLSGDEADFLCYTGLAFCKMKQTDEGLEALYKALKLSQKHNSWPSVVAYFNTIKKLNISLNACGRSEETCKIAQQGLRRLEAMQQSTESITDIPPAIVSDSAALDEFIQYYKTPITAHLVEAYVLLDQLDSAKIWYKHFCNTGEANNPDVSQAIIHPLIVFGNYAEAKQRISEAKVNLGADTISQNYLELLELEQMIAEKEGSTAEDNLCLQRILALKDSLHSRDYEKAIANASVQFKLQEHELKYKRVQSKYLIAIIFILFSIAALLLFLAIRQIRRMHQKHSAMSAELAQAQQRIVEMKEKENTVRTEENTYQMEALYHRAVAIMETFKPFRNSDYSIQQLSEQLVTNRSYISNAINQYSGLTFRNWLAKYRIEDAKKLLLGKTSLTMEQIAIRCGFDNRQALYRHFKNFENMTPAEWLAAQKENEEEAIVEANESRK